MLNKNNCLRTCLYSNQVFPKQELIRLVKSNNKIVIDHKQNMLGRGYWIKLTTQALSDPKLIAILSKKCKTKIDPALIDELKKELN